MKQGLVVFMRIFLVVFGLIFIGGGGLVIHLAVQDTFDHDLVYGVTAGLAVLGGFALIWNGVFASPRTIDEWTGFVMVHEASLIPVLLAIPLFLIWAFIPCRRPPRRRASSGEFIGGAVKESRRKRARRRKRPRG